MSAANRRTHSASRIGWNERRRGMVAACLLLGVVVLSGCSLAPQHQTPSLPVSSAYPADTGMLAGATSVGPIAAEITWHEYFVDPYLRTLIAQALANSRDLRGAVLRVEEARATYGIQRANQFPTIAAGVDGSRARIPADLSITGRSGISSQYQVSLGLAAWELDFWGRVRNLKDAALENYLATDEARRAAKIGLIAEVADAYLTLLELDERSVLARRTIVSREESFRIFTRRYEVGAIARMDLVQVETLLHQAKTLAT